MKNVIKWFFLMLGGLVMLSIITLFFSIPYAKNDEPPVLPLGETYGKVVIKNVHLIPMDSNYVLENHSLFIEDGKIVSFLPDSLANYTGYEVIDGSGNYLMPALIDMHAHVFDRTDLAQFLSYGVGTIRNMMGFPMHLRWKEQQRNGELIGSKLITATPTLNSGDNTGPFHKTIESASEIPVLLNEYKQKGYDFIKIYDGITREQFDIIAKESSTNSLPFAGHPPRSVRLDQLSKSGISSIEHIEEIFQGLLNYKFDYDSAKNVARILAKNGVPVCVNLAAYHQVFMTVTKGYDFLNTQTDHAINPVIKFIGEKQLSEYPNYSQKGIDWTIKKHSFMDSLVTILNEAGVPLIFGTDTGPSLTVPGETVLWEISLLKNAGLADYEILRSATVEASKVLGRTDLGIIKNGASSDVILLKKNPLENATNIESLNTLLLGNTYYDENALLELRSIGENKQSAYSTIGNFLEHLIKK